MNWLRDIIRKWLGVLYGPELESARAITEAWHNEVTKLRTELDALKSEVRARNPEPQQVSLRISVDDYEASQLKTLEEFREEKGKS